MVHTWATELRLEAAATSVTRVKEELPQEMGNPVVLTPVCGGQMMPAQSCPLSGALESWQVSLQPAGSLKTPGPPAQPLGRQPCVQPLFINLLLGCLLSLYQLSPSRSFLLKIIILFTGSLYMGKMAETGSRADCFVVPFV